MTDAPAEPVTRERQLRDLEAVLFVADEPLTSAVLAQVMEADRAAVEGWLEQLARQYEESGSGLTLRRVAGGWRLYTHPEASEVVERFVLSSRHTRLTRAALETLAIVAYKQPVTRHQVSAIRGVSSEGVLNALVDRGLLAEVGREEGPGRPILYGTTPQFLERLGLDSVADLPSLAPMLGSDDHGEDAEPNGSGGAQEDEPPSGDSEADEATTDEPG
ncbi:MAG TPA: SMC-Scp complex subunit ScpB [Actinomycetota bacterium]|nr:SMC-Scp complex subunit ScpB [Actinomycetota bacterium]